MWQDGTISDVLYIPDLNKNLLSEGVLTGKNMPILKDGDKALVYQNNKVVAVAVRDTNNIYKMLFRTVILNVNLTSHECLKTWHERLGHINLNSISEIVKKNLVEGINIANMDKFVCEECCYGKSHELPFKKNVSTHM